MKISVIGAGLIGTERIKSLKKIEELTNHQVILSSVFDINCEILQKIKEKYNVPITQNINDIINDRPDWILIATPNNVVYDNVKLAFNAGANVLIEKPFGRSLEECNKIIDLKPANLKLNVGFNYRFFAGIEAALNDVKSGKFGNLISINMILGHGHAPGVENSWKLDPNKCGSVSIDLAVHLFDLMLQISTSDVHIDYGRSWKGVWNTGIEEEAHIFASNDEKLMFNAQVSFDRWRSAFKIEINGTEGYGIIEGRGRSYGSQSYRIGKKWGWLSGKKQAETETYIIENNDCADSFLKETISALGLSNQIPEYNYLQPACSYNDAKNIMTLLNEFEQKRII